MVKLRTLWIGDNRLCKLSSSIVNLKNLDWEATQLSSNVSGNPLVDPPLEVCEKGIKNIAVYYRAVGRRKSSLRELKRSSITDVAQKLAPVNEARRGSSVRNFKFKNDIKKVQLNDDKKQKTQQNSVLNKIQEQV